MEQYRPHRSDAARALQRRKVSRHRGAATRMYQGTPVERVGSTWETAFDPDPEVDYAVPVHYTPMPEEVHQTRSFFVAPAPERVINSFASKAGSELKYFDTHFLTVGRVTSRGPIVEGSDLMTYGSGPLWLTGSSSTNPMLISSPKQYALNALKSGNGPTEREGRSAYFSSAHVIGSIRIHSNSTYEYPYGGFYGDIVLVLDRQFSGTVPALTDIWDRYPYRGTPAESPNVYVRNMAKVTRFSILASQRLVTPVAEGKSAASLESYLLPVDFTAKLDFSTDYVETATVDGHAVDASLTRNAIFLFILSPYVAGHAMPAYQFLCRLRFRG